MKTAICAIIKNEHLFLKEWIDWHLGLGFDAIHLFEDKDSKSHEEICEKYSNVYLRRYEDDEELKKIISPQFGDKKQLRLYQWFCAKCKYNWVAFIDIDEFIMFEDDWNLNRLCDEFSDYPAVHLYWRMKGASGHIKRPSCDVMEAYTEDALFISQDIGWNMKSLVNICKGLGMRTVHHAYGAVRTDFTEGEDPIYAKAWINHYFTKSWEDWYERIYNRGDLYKGHRTLAQFFECNPNMKYLEDKFYYKYSQIIPNGCYRIKGDIIAGGNTNKIMLLNCNTRSINLSQEERLGRAIKEASKYGFENRGRENLVHIIWLGKNEFPELTIKCMKSWKKYLTNQTICIWTEDSLDLSHDFVKIAYENKSWAFASDYLRLWVIHKYGGVYIDTDVELIKPIDNTPTNFMGLEKGFNNLALGLMFGAEKGNCVIYDMMSMYDHFFFSLGRKDDFIMPILTTNYFKSRGYVRKDGIHSFLGFTIFPSEYFSPIDFLSKEKDITDNTYSIHHYMGSWKKLMYDGNIMKITLLNQGAKNLYKKFSEKARVVEYDYSSQNDDEMYSSKTQHDDVCGGNLNKIHHLNCKLNKKYYTTPSFEFYKNDWVLLNDNFATLAIAKIGCTTIFAQSTCYNENTNIDFFKNIKYKHACEIISSFFTSARKYRINKDTTHKKVILFRNPKERLISAWKNMFNNCSFDEFIINVHNTFQKCNTNNIDQHINLQCNYYDFDDIDVFVELNDYPQFCRDHNIPWVALNQTSYKDEPPSIPMHLERLIEDIYKEDYKLIEKIKASNKIWNCCNK